MSDLTTFLALLQLADSAFPAGGFAHSAGLEQLVRDGQVTSAEDVERFVRSLTRYSIATGDATAAAIASRAMAGADLAAAVRVDGALFAAKAPSELRVASTSMGLRLLREVTAQVDKQPLRQLLEVVEAGRAPGTHAVAFGAVAGVVGVEPAHAAAALMHATAMSILQAAMRLLPVSHRDVQGALHRLRPEIAEFAALTAEGDVDALRSFHPLQEIASMRHRVAAVRLFAS